MCRHELEIRINNLLSLIQATVLCQHHKEILGQVRILAQHALHTSSLLVTRQRWVLQELLQLGVLLDRRIDFLEFAFDRLELGRFRGGRV